MSYTTIQIDSSTRANLTKFKEYARETYDEVINKLMKIAQMASRDEGELSDETLKQIKEAEEDYKAGRTFSTKEVLKRLGA